MKTKPRAAPAIVGALRDAVVDELARQAGTGRVSVQVPSDPKRADEVIVEDGIIVVTPQLRAIFATLRDADEWRTALIALRAESS